MKHLGTALHRMAVSIGTIGVAMVCNQAAAQQDTPKYGGTLNVATVNTALATRSWDLIDWQTSTQTRDTGQFYEQLFTSDLSKARSRGGKYAFVMSGWEPSDTVRGELAESWSWPSPLVLEVKLRKGVLFPAKAGVMAQRELVADDIVFNFNRQNSSPKKTQGYYEYLDKVEAKDKHTVVFVFNKFQADWDYRFGNGFFSGIVPKEVVDAGAANWKNLNGTGPFVLSNVAQGNSLTFEKNPVYWDKEVINKVSYKLPLVDKVVHNVIKDEAAQNAALRTGKLDILSSISRESAVELKRSTPALKWNRWLSFVAPRVALRVDTKPFTDVRVRRALNMAVNKQEIIDKFYGGDAEMLNYPMHPEFNGYFTLLKDMPASVQELFKYDPTKAKKLLAEAGYPQGFSFKVQVCSCWPDQMELMPLVAAYLEAVGVKLEIVPMEFATHLASMSNRTHTAGFVSDIPALNPLSSLRTSFSKGSAFNPSVWDDPKLEAVTVMANRERDEGKRQKLLKDQTLAILDQAPAIWMPAPYRYTAWWPWVRNYGGELFVGPGRFAGIHARVWIDDEMKKKMGF
jgi:peptide/nickel transport system substrate-binding protein